jgi:hypothetical protein
MCVELPPGNLKTRGHEILVQKCIVGKMPTFQTERALSTMSWVMIMRI